MFLIFVIFSKRSVFEKGLEEMVEIERQFYQMLGKLDQIEGKTEEI